MKTSAPAERVRGNPEILWVLMTVIAGSAMTVWVFHPGFMSADSVDQLTQGRTGSFNDWHPPIMSWLWGRLDLLWPGPIGMLVFHNLLFWAGLGLLIHLLFSKRPVWLRCLLILMVGLYPPIFMLLSTIWKDVGMTASLLFGAASLFYAEKRRSRPFFILAMLALGYALAVRHNAIFAVLPLAVYSAAILRRLGLFRGSSYLETHRHIVIPTLGLILLGSIFLTTRLLEHRLFPGESSYPEQQIMIHDLAGISVQTREILLPDYLMQPAPLTMRQLRAIYTPGTVGHLFWADDGRARLPLTRDPQLISGLRAEWLAVLLEHPKAYLIHRSAVFFRQYWLAGRRVCYPFHEGIFPNSLGLSYARTPLIDGLFALAEQLAGTPLYRGWIYLVIVLLPLLYALAQGAVKPGRNYRLSAFTLALSSSAALFGLAYFFVSAACDFRYLFWVVVVAVILVLLGISEGFDRSRRGSGARVSAVS